MAAGGENWDGLGIEAGGRDAASESRAAAELISVLLPSSPRHPPSLPEQQPPTHRCPAGLGRGGQQPPKSCLSRPSPAASCSPALHLGWGRRRVQRCPSPLLCAGTRAGAVCPRRSPAGCRTPGARQARLHRSPLRAPLPLLPGTPMPPAQDSGDWDTWERTVRPFGRCWRPPARVGLLPPWHVPSPRSVAAGGTGLAVPTAAMVGAGSRR